MKRTYRTNRAVGTFNKGDRFTAEPSDPMVTALLGAGYLEEVSGLPATEEVQGLPNIEEASPAFEPETPDLGEDDDGAVRGGPDSDPG